MKTIKQIAIIALLMVLGIVIEDIQEKLALATERADAAEMQLASLQSENIDLMLANIKLEKPSVLEGSDEPQLAYMSRFEIGEDGMIQFTPPEPEPKQMLAGSEEEPTVKKVYYTAPTDKDEPFVLKLLDQVIPMLKDPEFYHADAVGGVSPEVREATDILLGYYKEIPIEDRFSEEEVAAFMVREAKYWDKVTDYSVDNPKGTFRIDLNTERYGDNGPLQLRACAYNEVLVDKDKRMPFSVEDRARLAELGIGDADFRGNLLLSRIVFEFWHQRYTTGKKLYTRAGCFNAGPTGHLKRGRGHSYAKAVVNFHKEVDNRIAARVATDPTYLAAQTR